MAARAHHHAAAPGAITFLDAHGAVNNPGGGEVGGGHDLDQFLDAGVRFGQQLEAGVDYLVHVVRRDVGGHADRNPGGAVDQQVGNLGRQHQRFEFGAVVVGAEIHRFLVEVGQQFMGDLGHANFGVTHRGGVVAVHRAEVALAVHQRITQRKILRHAHDGVVHGGVAVGVIFTDHVADDTRRLLVSLVPVVGQLVHGEQYAAMHGLQAIAHIRQGAPHDYAHGVIEVGTAHFFFQTDRDCFFGELIHKFYVFALLGDRF
jgi:hypothetical protein